MPIFERDEIRLHYEVHGEGFPVLLFAPGGMRSAIAWWKRAPWNALQALSPHFRCIALDQRNAESSFAPISAEQGWDDYTADHLALLDHLHVQRCHLVGMCIGGAFILNALKRHPDRFAAAVAVQPIGLSDNRLAFHEIYESWRQEIAPAHPEAGDDDWRGLRDHLYGGDFVFSTSRDEARAATTPLLVLRGDDTYHPDSISRDLAALVGNGELVEHWKEPPHRDAAVRRIIAFLTEHATP